VVRRQGFSQPSKGRLFSRARTEIALSDLASFVMKFHFTRLGAHDSEFHRIGNGVLQHISTND
jgi:hypothetical protein